MLAAFTGLEVWLWCCIVTESFVCFAGMCVLMGLWAAFFLPETKGVEIEGVYRLFTNHWFWGKTLGQGRENRAENVARLSGLPYTGTASGLNAQEQAAKGATTA